MLTEEILKNVEGLTEAQISAIATLSKNDESNVIGARIGEIYGGIDADILAASGIPKDGTEKTYEYAKRIIGKLKSDAEASQGLQSTIDSLTKEKTRLEKVIADGVNDSEAAKQLKQARTDLEAVKAQYNELNTKHQEVELSHAKALHGLKIDSALEAASMALKFKANLPEAATKVLLNQATAKIKGMTSEDVNGAIVFKDENGAVMTNPKNLMNPYTASELLINELDTMGVLEIKTPAGGAGSNPNNKQDNKVVDVTQARTRVEANEAIRASLLAQGLTIGSAEYDAAATQAWKDNNVSALPEK